MGEMGSSKLFTSTALKKARLWKFGPFGGPIWGPFGLRWGQFFVIPGHLWFLSPQPLFGWHASVHFWPFMAVLDV